MIAPPSSTQAPAGTEVLRFQRPELPDIDEIGRYFRSAQRIAWFSNGGPCHAAFTERIEGFVGGGVHAVPVANCTLGIMAVLRAVTVDQHPARRLVITPSYTFAAAASAVMWAGFLPLFVDVDPVTWQMDPAKLAEALDAHQATVAAVLGTSTFGCPAPRAVVADWQRSCDHHEVPLVLDSAAGFGAEDESGCRIGGRGAAEVFSFHATKPFAIGEGGAITTRNAALAERLRRIVNFDFDAERHVVSRMGFNAKLDELHSAVGLAVFDHYEQILRERRAAGTTLKHEMAPLGFAFQPGCESATWQHVPTQAPRPADRDAIVELGARHHIEIRCYFDVPLHRQPALSGLPAYGTLAVTEGLSHGALSLPMSNSLSAAELQRIIDLLGVISARAI